jgi:hypothetical protein
MRRTALTLATAAVLTIALASAAGAGQVGPGGWAHVGVGSTAQNPSLNGAVYALNTSNPGVLYAGGNFTSAGGNTKAQRIARWNGSTWSSLGNTPISNGGVFAIAYSAGKVYVGGTFQDAGGNPNADFLAVWNGVSWAPFCNSTRPGPAFTANVNALQIVGNTLYVGGAFADGAGITTADYLVACDLTTGAASSTVPTADQAFGGAVDALTADSNGTLYAGGGFINLGTIPAADHIASFSGGVWHAMGTGPGPGGAAVDSFVRSLTATGTNVYVGTDSVNVGGITNADHVARWDGSSWTAVGSNTAGTDGWFPASSFIYGLATYGSLVIAAGSFQNANGNAAADQIAYFNGVSWRPVGSDGAGNGPLAGQATALGVTGGQVYVSGNFTSAGGDTLATSVAAYGLRLPDASIGAKAAGHFEGNNVYSSTGAGEVRHARVKRGSRVTSYVRIQNDGLVAASFDIKGTGGAHGITARYFRGRTNITTKVRAGTYGTASVAPGARVVLRVVVRAASSSAAQATFLTSARSTTGTPPDAVRFVTEATG